MGSRRKRKRGATSGKVTETEPVIRKYTGTDISFPYEYLPKIVKPIDLQRYTSQLRAEFAGLANKKQAADEWIVRCHASIKMLMAATVFLSSLKYASAKRLRIVEPYLTYYSLMTISRALLFLLPDERWEDGALLTVQHNKVVAKPSRRLKQLSPFLGERHHELIKNLKVLREFFSYNFPARGLTNDLAGMVPDAGELIDHASAIAEVCQLHSECMATAFKAKPPRSGSPSEKLLESYHVHIRDAFRLSDSEDWYRIDRAFRKMSRPTDLWCTVTDGMVEDFFDSWEGDETGLGFRMDEGEWSLIFPM